MGRAPTIVEHGSSDAASKPWVAGRPPTLWRPSPVRYYEPDPESRTNLHFLDATAAAPTAPDPAADAPRRHRSIALGVVAVVAVLVGVLLVLARTDGDRATTADAPAAVDHGPFDTPEELFAALALPDSFTRVAEEDVSSFADAEYAVDGDFTAACEALGDALRAVDPTYPRLQLGAYAGGGVHRCQTVAPMAALGGRTVRALVLQETRMAQIRLGDPVATPTTGG